MLDQTTRIHTSNGIEIAFQPVAGLDDDFLLELFIETRTTEFASLGWDERQLRQFLGMQYRMQSQSYKMQHPAADHLLVISDKRIGRLVIDRSDKQISIVDISLLRSAQNQGIGTAIIGRLVEDAAAEKLGLTLQVSETNLGARRLYDRLGFLAVRQHETYTEMEWRRERELNV